MYSEEFVRRTITMNYRNLPLYDNNTHKIRELIIISTNKIPVEIFSIKNLVFIKKKHRDNVALIKRHLNIS